jgi:hypothetical protein
MWYFLPAKQISTNDVRMPRNGMHKMEKWRKHIAGAQDSGPVFNVEYLFPVWKQNSVITEAGSL